MRVFAVLMLAALLTGCTATTESTEVGVRTTKLGWSPGVQNEIYPQGGTYFFLRPLSDFNVYDMAVQNLVMFREASEGIRREDDSLRFKTVDGNDVSVNVTVVWAVKPDMAPYLLQFVGGSTFEIEEKLVRPVARTVTRDVLNQLTSEEYYQAERRFEMAEEAKIRLNILLENDGIFVEQILLGEHKFTETYEQTIRDKKVAEQEAERLVSETEAAREEMLRDLARTKGTVQQTVEQAMGEAERRQLEADAILFERERQAEALLSEKQAIAEGLLERARAMAGPGGRQMVKLKLAEALRGKKVIFVPAGQGTDLRTTDMNDLLEIYGVKSLAK